MPPGPAVPPVPLLVVVYAFFLIASIIGAWIWAIIRLALGLSVIPRFTPRVVPWRGPAVLMVVVVWLAVQVYGPSLYLRLRGLDQRQGVAPVFQPSDMMIASAIENTGLLLALPLLLGAVGGARPRDFLGEGGQGRRSVRAIQGMAAWPLIAPAVYGAMMVAVWVWGKGTHPLERAIQTEGLGSHAWVLFLASVALAPMAEELVFRGAILGWLTRVILLREAAQAMPAEASAEAAFRLELDPTPAAGPIVLDGGGEVDVTVSPMPAPWPTRDEYTPPAASLIAASSAGSVRSTGASWGAVAGRLLVANVLVSVLFAALHFMVWPTPVPIFFLSLVLGLLYQRTGSLVGPVVLHMTFNGVSTVLMFLAFGAGPANPGPARPNPAATPSTPARSPQPPIIGPIPIDNPAPVPGPITEPR